MCAKWRNATLSSTIWKGPLIIKLKANFSEDDYHSHDKLSLLEKLLPGKKEEEETDEMDQVELVDSVFHFGSREREKNHIY